MTKPAPYTETKTVMNFIDMKGWIDEKYGINQRDYAGRHKGGLDASKPYQDFWHFQMDSVINLNGNDSYSSINLEYQLEAAEEDWQKEIAQMWLDEFGEYVDEYGDIELWVSW